MKVAVIGTGYVGLVSGVCLASKGHEVTCVDLDPVKIDRINAADPPIHEAGLADLLAEVVGAGRLTATTDLPGAVRGAEVTLIAVGTPFDGSAIDLAQIRTVARAIGAAIATHDGWPVVVVKSTVVPGTTEDVVLPILEEASGKRAGEGFGVAMNPEFLKEGEAIADFMEPDRIVLGGIDERSIDVLERLYSAFPDTDRVRTTPRTAEKIKYASNALLATLISFSNEIANLCDKIGVDVTEVLAGVHLDKRFSPIMKDGTRVRPASLTYLEAGCGFGGSCFPKDVKALIAHGEAVGAPMGVLSAVIAVNEAQPAKLVEKLRIHLPDLAGRRISLLGVAFKPGTDDIRESPALPVARALLDAGAHVTVFDPVAHGEARKVFGTALSFAEHLEGAVAGADAVILVTNWPEFARLPELLETTDAAPVIIDGRRLFSPDAITDTGSVYEGVGLGRV